jgi:hypothetical protein
MFLKHDMIQSVGFEGGQIEVQDQFIKIERDVLNKITFVIILAIIVVIAIAPMLYIGQFSHLVGDDYWYGLRPHVAWRDERSIFAVYSAIIDNLRWFHHNWQGTYSSIFMMSLVPGVFGEQYYAVTPVMMSGMTFISMFLLLHVIFVKFLHTGLKTFLIIFLVTFFAQITLVYSPAGALYWYNGAVHYVFMQGFVYISLSLLLKYIHLQINLMTSPVKRSTVKQIVLLFSITISGFIAAGANFSSSLLNIELYTIACIIIIYLFFKHKAKNLLFFLIPYTITLTGFIINIAAPGNQVRQEYFYRGMGFGEAMLNSFSYSFSKMLLWIDLYIVLLLLLLVPFIIKYIQTTSFKFSFAPLVAVVSYCLYASMFMPAFYSMGWEPISRNQNICKMFLIFILILNEVYLIGWLAKRSKHQLLNHIIPIQGKNLWYWFGYLAIIIASFTLSLASMEYVSRKATFVPYAAWDVIATGVGRQFHHEYLIRLNEKKNNDDLIIYVQSYTVKPYPLYTRLESEESFSEDGLLDVSMATWYGKHGIYEYIVNHQ